MSSKSSCPQYIPVSEPSVHQLQEEEWTDKTVGHHTQLTGNGDKFVENEEYNRPYLGIHIDKVHNYTKAVKKSNGAGDRGSENNSNNHTHSVTFTLRTFLLRKTF